jgi:hypothetical protein
VSLLEAGAGRQVQGNRCREVDTGRQVHEERCRQAGTGRQVQAGRCSEVDAGQRGAGTVPFTPSAPVSLSCLALLPRSPASLSCPVPLYTKCLPLLAQAAPPRLHVSLYTKCRFPVRRGAPVRQGGVQRRAGDRAEKRDEDEGEAVPREDVGRQPRRREEHHRDEPAPRIGPLILAAASISLP